MLCIIYFLLCNALKGPVEVSRKELGKRVGGKGVGGRVQLQRRGEAAGVSCQSSPEEEQDPGPR